MVNNDEECLICPICKDSISNNISFQKHFLSKHVEPTKFTTLKTRVTPIHKCPVCNIVVEDELSLIKHGLAAHKDLEPHSSECEEDSKPANHDSLAPPKNIKKERAKNSNTKSKHSHSNSEEVDLKATQEDDDLGVKNDEDKLSPVTRKRKRGRPPKCAKSKVKERKSLNCSYCDYCARNKSSLLNHISKQHDHQEKDREDLLQKAFCDSFCCDAGISKNHKCGKEKKETTEKCMDCMYCSFKAESRQIVKEHIMVHHKEQIRPCPQCDYVALGRVQLYQHISHRHNKGSIKKWPCKYCSFIADTSRALAKHGAANHKELGHKCSQCDKITMTKDQLYKHVTSKHKKKQDIKNIEKPTRFTHQCEYCNFTDKMDKLVQHRISKHKDKVQAYNCPSCEFESYEESILNGHVIMEHSEHSKLVAGLICCPHCNFTTIHIIKLKSHFRRCHRDLRPVRDKKYRCELDNCDYTNDNLKEYNSHRYTVHGIKPLHSCLQFGCEFVGKTRLDLRTHLESVHNLPMKMENHEFASESDYIAWIRSIESETCSRYVQHSVNRNHISYVCNRSGRHYIPVKEKAKALQKKQNHTSLKSGITCTSIITGSKHPDGLIKVEACLTHYGHEVSAEGLNLAHNERKFLEEKLLAGESYAKIISEIRKDLESHPNTRLQRLHMVGKKYLQFLKFTLRKKNIYVPKVTSKKKEIANAKQSFDKVLANRIEQKLSALKAYTSDLSSSNLIEIDKKLSALDELVGGLPGIDKVSSTEEKDEIEESSEADKKPLRKRKSGFKKGASEESQKQVYVGAHTSEGLCIDNSQQQDHISHQHRQQMTELEPSRPSYFDLSQAQISILHTDQPPQAYTTNFEEFSHFIT